MRALAVILREEFDTPFRFYDAATGQLVVIPGQDERAPATFPGGGALALDLAAAEHPKLVVLPDGRYLLGFPLDGIGPSRLLAVGVLSALAGTRPEMA